MGKVYEALERKEAESKQNFLQPVKREVKDWLPAVAKTELLEFAPEWYKELQIKIQAKYAKEDLKTILFTGISKDVGCSSIAAGYAICLAKAFRKKVLLIDANYRSPALQRYFDSDINELKELLLIEEDMLNHWGENTDGNLQVISCNGDESLGIGNLFSSKQFEEILNRAKEKFDYIIFDSAPAGTTPEILMLAKQVDGVILVLSSGKTKKEVALKTKKELESIHANIIGTVLNRRKYVIPRWLYERT